MEQDDPIGKADALLMRLRAASPVTATEGFPVLTDVVAAAPAPDHKNSLPNSLQAAQRNPDPDSGPKGAKAPLQPVPDIQAIVTREVLKRLELMLPDIAAEAGLIAQQVLEARIREWNGANLGNRQSETAQTESCAGAAKPRQV